MPLNWNVDGSETRLCFPHSADVGSLHIQARLRYIDVEDEASDWEEYANFVEDEDSGEFSVFPTTIRAYDSEDWSSIQLEISVIVRDAEGHKQLVTHPDDDGYTGTFGINAISSSGTKYQSRTRKWFAGDKGETSCSLDLTFRKGDHAGEIILHPRSLLSESLGDAILDGKARRKNSILATGVPIRIQFDKPRSMPGSDIIHTWADFDGSYVDALIDLKVNEDAQITCYWNNRYTDLKQYIDSKTKTGKKAAWRESIFSTQRAEIVRALTIWAATEDAETDDIKAELAKKILNRVGKWTGKSASQLKTMHGVGEDVELDPEEVMVFNRLIQHKFVVGNSISKLNEVIE
mgnify:CR=1 FL=1